MNALITIDAALLGAFTVAEIDATMAYAPSTGATSPPGAPYAAPRPYQRMGASSPPICPGSPMRADIEHHRQPCGRDRLPPQACRVRAADQQRGREDGPAPDPAHHRLKKSSNRRQSNRARPPAAQCPAARRVCPIPNALALRPHLSHLLRVERQIVAEHARCLPRGDLVMAETSSRMLVMSSSSASRPVATERLRDSRVAAQEQQSGARSTALRPVTGTRRICHAGPFQSSASVIARRSPQRCSPKRHQPIPSCIFASSAPACGRSVSLMSSIRQLPGRRRDAIGDGRAGGPTMPCRCPRQLCFGCGNASSRAIVSTTCGHPKSQLAAFRRQPPWPLPGLGRSRLGWSFAAARRLTGNPWSAGL